MNSPFRFSLDIETECAQDCTAACEHGLDAYRNRITVVGVTWNGGRKVFRALPNFQAWLAEQGDYVVEGFNLKWDLNVLFAHGVDIPLERWVDDALLMAATYTNKVTEEYLGWYERERKRLNESRPKGKGHRPGSQHGLKVLAPYFLGKAPFWETEDHDNDDYVLADAEYTAELRAYFETKLKEEGSYEFYADKLLPWCRMLIAAERRGISLDLAALDEASKEAAQQAAEAKRQLDEMWAPAYKVYDELQHAELKRYYDDKHTKAAEKAKDKGKCRLRYEALYDRAAAKLEPFNLDSPTQLTWLLRDHLKLDISDFDGEETTGKPVLQKLAGQGRIDIEALLRYRKGTKLSQAFFPAYKEMQVNSVIHCSFNPTGTRTGRLSSSRPNLQQVEKGIHHLFRARPGYKLATYDMSAIEPRIIAYYSHDLNLFDILKQGRDFHNYNTAIFFDLDIDAPNFKTKYKKERDVGKEVALALMYGAGTNRLMESAQKRGFVWSQKEARYKLQRFKEFYEGVYRFREEVVNPTLMAGETITNLLGRPFRIDDPTNVHMQGLNSLVQGSASDLVINSAYRISNRFKERSIDGHVLLLVHDEIVTEIPAEREAEAVGVIEKAMTDYALPTPLGPIELKVEGSVSDTWTK